MSHGYFSYIRVSTQRQGQQGTSLTEQTGAIDRYAKTWNLPIVKRFEERETAAKQGRPVFLEMVKALKERKARGVIIHKIDRSARNLRDWAELGSLIDLGTEVHFVNESLDLSSRGGRLSADIQAVVASDYIRNLREETIKGMHGRVKQGFYPLPAPIGYVDKGAAKAKEFDPIRAPLLKRAFELYATGRYGLIALSDEMYRLGLRNRGGKQLSKNALNVCLRNPFYAGLVRLRSMSETYLGQHTALVPKRLFDNVQAVLAGKRVKKSSRHSFIFRRYIKCSRCGNSFTGELQKGHRYYRCHTRMCSQQPHREVHILEQFSRVLKTIEFDDVEMEGFRKTLLQLENEEPRQIERQKQELSLRIQQIDSKLDRLADGYMDGIFDRDIYKRKQETLLGQRVRTAQNLAELGNRSENAISNLKSFFELAKSAYLSFKKADDAEKREFVEIVCSNITADGKSLIFKLNSPFQEVYDRPVGPTGGPFRDTFRTNPALLSQVFDFFVAGGALRQQSEGHLQAEIERKKMHAVRLHLNNSQKTVKPGGTPIKSSSYELSFARSAKARRIRPAEIRL